MNLSFSLPIERVEVLYHFENHEVEYNIVIEVQIRAQGLRL